MNNSEMQRRSEKIGKRKSVGGDLKTESNEGDAQKKVKESGDSHSQENVSVKTKPAATPPGKGIRTRLSTGTLIMTGTSTVSTASQESMLTAITANLSSDNPVKGRKSISKDSTPTSAKKRKIAEEKSNDEQSDIPPKRRKIGRNDGTGEDNKNDYFCWACHKEGQVICCELCPRVFHTKCLSLENKVSKDWVCPECEKIMKAECTDTRSKAMAMITLDKLCTLLKYALERMRTVGASTFEHPVDPLHFPNYTDYVFFPMSLGILEKNIRRKLYGCTEAFLADAKWIFHNSAVYNGSKFANKITSAARSLMKVCKHEMSEIEVCPDCYYHSCVQNNSDWFCEPCRVPHGLVWAKLKGYPFWPAKALREVNGQVDVRFFGAHDRSWVPVASCFMLSRNGPVVVKKGRGGMDLAMKEVALHVKKLKEKFGSFEYAPPKTPFSIDNVYKKTKNVSVTSSEQNKDKGRSEMKSKVAVRVKMNEVQSAASKTAMALKTKYNTITLKKGNQQHGTVVLKSTAAPGPQQRQIIYLKPMPKGVFLLSQQQIDPGPTQSTSALKPNLPVLKVVQTFPENRPLPVTLRQCTPGAPTVNKLLEKETSLSLRQSTPDTPEVNKLPEKETSLTLRQSAPDTPEVNKLPEKETSLTLRQSAPDTPEVNKLP
ncbi:unnamed protein product, partial [Lymnaea stagnalis]